MSVNEKPYGSWESPITSKAITASSVAISSLSVHGSQLYWLEGRPQESGRYVLCRYAPDADSAHKSERNAVDVTPKGSNVRTRVHEYGGSSYVLVGNNDPELYYSEFTTQQLCKLTITSQVQDLKPIPVTPEGERFRFADGVYDQRTKSLIMVREDHQKPAPKDVVNEIVAVLPDQQQMSLLATGNDFYSAPRVSPDATKLAYITWNHPNMPWDATQLRVIIDLDAVKNDPNLAHSSNHTLVAGDDGDTSIMQPLWHPQTGHLYYISDQSGYYNIYRWGVQDSVLFIPCDFGGAAPGWRLGQQGFTFLPDGRLLTHYSKNGTCRLVLANVVDNPDGPATNIQEYTCDDGLPMLFDGVVPSNSRGDDAAGDIYFIGGTPSTPMSVYRWNINKRGPVNQLASSSSLVFPDQVISIPKQIEFPTTLGNAYAYYYPPRNDAFRCTTDVAPPLLVKAHGGPTACTGTSFNARIQYWTSRGFAVLDVDYGGSTGYGRDYRRRLRGSWGIVDIDDVCAGAMYLVKQGLADEKRLCIDGGSAGGYTTLGALAFKDVFKAGCSLYGVADLSALAQDTHKFESRYLDGLVGPYPEAEHIYKERSPIESIDKLSCPILLLQGDEDKIVPPGQAESMHKALLQKGIPTCLKMYQGEQHGFRKAENIEDAIDSELSFFGRIFGINVPNAIHLEIQNL